MASPNNSAVLDSLGDKVLLGVSDLADVAVQVTGTFTGTLTFEVTLDGRNFETISMTPSNSTTTVTTATAGGIWMASVNGIVQFQVRMSSFTSGSAVVTIQGQGE